MAKSGKNTPEIYVKWPAHPSRDDGVMLNQIIQLEAESNPDPYIKKKLRKYFDSTTHIYDVALLGEDGPVIGYSLYGFCGNLCFMRKLKVVKKAEADVGAVEMALIGKRLTRLDYSLREHLIVPVGVNDHRRVKMLSNFHEAKFPRDIEENVKKFRKGNNGQIPNFRIISEEPDYFGPGKAAYMTALSLPEAKIELNCEVLPVREYMALGLSVGKKIKPKPFAPHKLIMKALARLSIITGEDWEVVARSPSGEWQRLDDYSNESKLADLSYRTKERFYNIERPYQDLAEFFDVNARMGRADISGQLVIPALWIRQKYLEKGTPGCLKKNFDRIEENRRSSGKLREEDGGMRL